MNNDIPAAANTRRTDRGLKSIDFGIKLQVRKSSRYQPRGASCQITQEHFRGRYWRLAACSSRLQICEAITPHLDLPTGLGKGHPAPVWRVLVEQERLLG